MKAKMVNEFQRGVDPKKALGIGTTKDKFMAWKVLEFIGNKGEEGASLKEIQYYIWTVLEKKPEAEFWEKSNGYSSRKTRGHWNTNLLGGPFYHTGLLHEYCQKNNQGKWILVKMPGPKENLYKYR